MATQVEWPEVGEIVVVKIKRVLDYGVFVDLLEYKDVAGFVHISEIASRWVKNIRNHVKENQVRAAKVLSLKPDKNQIDLSLTKVSEGLQRQKIDEWKKTKRAQKLIELFAQKHKVSFEKAWEEIVEPLFEHYDSVFEAFSAIALEGKTAAKGVPTNWVEPLVELCRASIMPPQKTVENDLFLSSPARNGVEHIREALLEGRKAGKGFSIEVFYKGGGHFAVRVTASNFKQAEKGLEAVTAQAISTISKRGGKATAQKVER